MTKFYLRTMLKNRSLKHYALLTWLLLGFLDTQAQTDLCLNATGTVSIDKTTGCSPLSVNITSPTNLNTVTYIYDYKIDGVLNTAPSAEVSTLNNDYLTNASIGTRVFTVLQKGLNAAGQNIYACANITVKPGVKPVFSYNSCGNNYLNLIIPLNTANTFDSYEINFGDASPITSITPSSLPFSTNRTYAVSLPTRNISIKGINNVEPACSAIVTETINMNNGGDYPKITSLEVNPDKVTAKLTFTGAFDTHDVYQRSETGTYTLGNIHKQSNPGTIDVTLSDPNQTCFMVARSTGCLNLSGEVCSIKLNNIIPQNAITNVIPYKSHPINIIRDINFLQTRISNTTYKINWQEINGIVIDNKLPISSNLNPYIQTPIDCKKKYCYQIEATVTGAWSLNSPPSITYTSISKSAWECIDRKILTPPKISNIFVDVVDDNTIDINYNDNSGWTSPSIVSYDLYSEEDNFVLPIASNTINAGKFSINKPSNVKSHCFKINYTDLCQSTSLFSDPVCSLNLKALSNQLSWTNTSPFASAGAGFTNFDLIRYTDVGVEQSQKTMPNTQITETALYNDQDYTKEVKFKVRAINSLGQLSNSNVIAIPLEVKVFLPDVFTPNSDANNSEWFAQGKFGRLAKFDLKIYDRWGSIVFQSTDKNFKWDGRSQGKLLNQGSYFYKLDMNLDTGESQTKTGEILILY